MTTVAGCYIFVALTLPFECALRATQQTHYPLFASIFAFSSNTFLNFVFIFGHLGVPAMGIRGAALATVISRGVQMLIIYLIVFARKNIISDNFLRFFGWKKGFVGRIVKNSIPTTLNESLWGLGTAMYVAAYARIGITEYATVQAATTIQNIVSMAAFSMGDAVLILVGQRLGRGLLEEAFGLAKRLVKIALMIGILFGLLLIAIAKPMVSLFNFTPEGSHLAFLILVVMGGSLWLVVVNAVNITGTLRCGGDTRFAMFSEVGAVWLIGVPMAFLSSLVFQWPVYFCVLAVKSEEVVKGIFLTVRFFSGKWVRNVIDDLKIKGDSSK